MRFNVSARSPKRVPRASARMRRSVLGVVVAVVVSMTLSACASGHNQKGGGGEDQPMVVHLTNDLAPPSDVTVYAVTQDGVRRLMGDVPPNKDRAMKIPSDVARGSTFRLVAERTSISRPVVSQPISATTDGLIIDWSLQTNAIWFPESGN